MVKLEQVVKIFKSDLLAQPFVALDKVSFNIPDGSLVGFLGANGAGKTTSLKIIMDFIRADSGEVIFSPSLGNTRSEILKRVGFLPERPYFYPNLNGDEFLNMLGTLSETPKSVLQPRIKHWSQVFSIDHALKRPLKTYSKGMLQRIGFLAAILHDPEFVILDEPLSGLDPVGRKGLKDVISDLHKKGKTIFFSSHVVPDIEEICDRVIFLEKGKLVYDGSVQNLIHSSPNAEIAIKIKGHRETVENILKGEGLIKSWDDLGSDYQSIKVSVESKQKMLSLLVSHSIDIVSLDIEKPTLEEIFYKIKNK